MNRKTNLSLDFSIPTQIERVKFITEYLRSYSNPSQRDLETMADYILWGKDEGGVPPSDYGLKTSWTPSREVSYEGLLEGSDDNDGLLESVLQRNRPLTKVQHLCLSRDSIRNSNPSPTVLAAFEDLWRRIDEKELMINYYEYDVSHKRTTPPRAELAMRFTGDEQIYYRELAAQWTQYRYLKARRELLEMRREQYILKDSVSQELLMAPTDNYYGEDNGATIDIRPLGFIDTLPQIWHRYPSPYDLTAADLDTLTKLLWAPTDSNAIVIDFENPLHVDKIIRFNDLDEIPQINALLKFYVSTLPPLAKDIYNMRKGGNSNEAIAKEINSKYNKHYRDNYISTLYSREVVNGIASAAKDHKETVQELFFPENFKKCLTCGRWLLRNDEHFTHRKRSSDGYYCHCKECESKRRKDKKE